MPRRSLAGRSPERYVWQVVVSCRVAALGVCVALACAAPAGAQTITIGQIAPPTEPGNGCFGCTSFQLDTAAASPSYLVPAGKWTRVSRWRIRGGASQKGHA